MQQDENYFFVKLSPPRPTFFFDMTDDERNVMKEHGVYWDTLVQSKRVLLFGPVIDPKGPYGMGVFEVKDIEKVWELITNDPVKKANLGTYEVYPMKIGTICK